MGTWLRHQRAIFFDNAPARKDFRIQLRGSRTMFQWSIFLLLIALFVYFAYTQVVSMRSERISLQMAQSSLQSVYQEMLAMLAGLVSLIAPAIGASAIVVERQRRFLDLLSASPMSGRYYLTGKLISSYRNIWMLLMLALPVVAVGAVMGGATYADVFKTFLVISLDGVIFSAVALAISAGAQKLPSALVLSYLCTALLIAMSSTVSSFLAFGGPRSVGGPQEMSIIGMLSPFAAAFAIQTVTTIAGIAIPNWLLFIPITIAVVELCLLGGVSALATKTVRATVWFRVLLLPLIACFGFWLTGFIHGAGGPAAPGQELAGPMAFLAFFIPFLSCFVADGPVKFTFDGGPKIRNTFRAVPSGAIYYLACLLLALFCGALIALYAQGNLHYLSAVSSYIVWLAGLYALVWAMSRLTSQFAGTLASARGLATVLVLVGLGFENLVADIMSADSSDQVFAPMSVLTSLQTERAVAWGLVLLVVAWVLSRIKLRRFRALLVENG